MRRSLNSFADILYFFLTKFSPDQMKPFLFFCLTLPTISSWVLACPTTSFAMDESASLELLVKVLNDTNDPNARISLMRGMLSGLAGRRQVESPKGWNQLSRELASSQNMTERDLSVQLSQIFGDPKAMQKAIALVEDKQATLTARRTALQTLLTQQHEELSSLLETLLDDKDLCLDAIRGYSSIEVATAPVALLNRFEDWPPALRRAVVETLATRKRYAEALLASMKEGAVSSEEVPAHVARSLNLLLGKQYVEAFGEARNLSADRIQLMKKYKAMCTPKAIANANAARGRAIYEKTCGSCHTMYGTGGKIGPDLTGSNRANLDYILLNSVDPSYDVPDGYKMVLVQTVDGRLINGVVAEEDSNRLILKTVQQPLVVISKEDIAARKISKKSMMPDGQLEQLKPQEVIDLIKYLRTTNQVELAK